MWLLTLQNTHRQVWVSLLWGHCSFLLGHGANSFVCVLQESVSPVLCRSCVSSGGSMVGLMVTSSERAYAIHKSAAPRVPAHMAGQYWPIPPQETLKGRSGSVSVGSLGAHKVLCEPAEHFWWVWGLILKAIFSSYYLAGVSPLPFKVSATAR